MVAFAVVDVAVGVGVADVAVTFAVVNFTVAVVDVVVVVVSPFARSTRIHPSSKSERNTTSCSSKHSKHNKLFRHEINVIIQTVLLAPTPIVSPRYAFRIDNGTHQQRSWKLEYLAQKCLCTQCEGSLVVSYTT